MQMFDRAWKTLRWKIKVKTFFVNSREKGELCEIVCSFSVFIKKNRCLKCYSSNNSLQKIVFKLQGNRKIQKMAFIEQVLVNISWNWYPSIRKRLSCMAWRALKSFFKKYGLSWFCRKQKLNLRRQNPGESLRIKPYWYGQFIWVGSFH